MKVLSEKQLACVSGGEQSGRDWNQCKTDVTNAASFGAIAGAAVGSPLGAGAIGAGVGALAGGAYGASNSPSCRGRR